MINEKKNNFKNLYQKILLINFLIFFTESSFAQAVSNSSKGVMKADVADPTINTNSINGDLIFNDLLDDLNVNTSPVINSGRDLFLINKKESGGGFASREKILHLNYKPDVFLNIAYGNNALSEQDNSDNLKGYAIVVLKNQANNVITAKVKIDNSGIIFDRNGKAELKVVSEFKMKNDQPKGTYRGYYHMIIVY